MSSGSARAMSPDSPGSPLDVIEPGSAPDVPPRLPVGAQDTIDTLSAIPHGYADPGTDIGEEISCQRESCPPPNPRTGPDVCWSPWRSPDTPPPTPYGTPPHSKN